MRDGERRSGKTGSKTNCATACFTHTLGLLAQNLRMGSTIFSTRFTSPPFSTSARSFSDIKRGCSTRWACSLPTISRKAAARCPASASCDWWWHENKTRWRRAQRHARQGEGEKTRERRERCAVMTRRKQTLKKAGGTHAQHTTHTREQTEGGREMSTTYEFSMERGTCSKELRQFLRASHSGRGQRLHVQQRVWPHGIQKLGSSTRHLFGREVRQVHHAPGQWALLRAAARLAEQQLQVAAVHSLAPKHACAHKTADHAV